MHESAEFPDLPADKQTFTLNETCALCCVKPHVLRYWEHQYKRYLAGITRRSGRRYYSPRAIHTIRRIVRLREQGLTSDGIKTALDGTGVATVKDAPDMNPSRVRAELALIAKLLEP